MESNQENSFKNINEQEKLVFSYDPHDTLKISKKKKSKNILRSLYGISFALLAAFCGGMISVTMRGANFFSGSDISFLRYILQLITMLAIGKSNKINITGVKEVRKNLILIGIFFAATAISLLFSVKFINPSESTALSQCYMLIVPIIARVYIKEKFHAINMFTLIMAIVGVFLISQPSFLFKSSQNGTSFGLNNNSSYVLNYEKGLSKIFGTTLALFSALFCAFGQIISKKIADKKVHFSIPCIYQSFVGLPLSLLISLILVFTGIQRYDLNLLKDTKNICYQILFAIGSSLFGIFYQIFLNIALKYEKSSRVSIIMATSLIFTFLFQYLILNINPNILSTLGVLLIFSSTLWIICFKILEQVLFKNEKNIDGKKNKKISWWKSFLFYKI